MKIFKIGLISASVALFVFACTENKSITSGNVDPNAVAVETPPGNPNAPANTNAQPSPQSIDLAAAGELFKTTCVKCHEHLDGGVHVMNGKRYKLPNFLSERMKNKLDEEYLENITNGIPDEGMPAFKEKLTEAQIRGLVNYIRREIQKK